MKNSKNPVVKFIADRGIKSAIGILGRNHIYLSNLYSYQHYNKWTRLMRPPFSDELTARSKQIHELLLARYGRGRVEHMSSSDIDMALEFICTY